MNSQLKKGYKLTEVGVIPEDWEVKLLNTLANIRSGIAKNSNVIVSDPILVHYLRVANVQDGFLDLSEMNQIEISRQDLKRYSVLSGDVLMNEGGDLDKLGRGSIWRGEFNPCIHQNHVFVVRCHAYLLPEYLNLWSSSTVSRRYFLLAGKQTTNLATINKTAIGQLPVAIPPLPEQRSIATVLSDTDALIESLEKAIVKKRNLKQATMQQLLTGKTRLPGFGEGMGYKQTELGLIPEDWELSRVSKIVLTHKQGYYTNNKYVENGTRLVRITDLYNPKIDYLVMPMLHISDKDFKQYKISKGDFLIARSGAIGRYGIVEYDMNAIFGSYIIRFNFNQEKILNRFFGYLFETQTIWKQLLSITQGSSNININAGNIKELMIQLPSIEEQKAIATVLSDMDAEIAALEQRRDKTRLLKQGMMQELLTGRTRLV